MKSCLGAQILLQSSSYLLREERAVRNITSYSSTHTARPENDEWNPWSSPKGRLHIKDVPSHPFLVLPSVLERNFCREVAFRGGSIVWEQNLTHWVLQALVLLCSHLLSFRPHGSCVAAVGACSCFLCLLKCQNKLLTYCSRRQIRASVINVNSVSRNLIVCFLWLWNCSLDSGGSEGGREGEPQKILPEIHPPFSRISYDPAVLPAPFPPPPSFLAIYKSTQCAFTPLQLWKVLTWTHCCALEVSLMKMATEDCLCFLLFT